MHLEYMIEKVNYMQRKYQSKRRLAAIRQNIKPFHILVAFYSLIAVSGLIYQAFT
jgi:hypothetical protein